MLFRGPILNLPFCSGAPLTSYSGSHGFSSLSCFDRCCLWLLCSCAVIVVSCHTSWLAPCVHHMSCFCHPDFFAFILSVCQCYDSSVSKNYSPYARHSSSPLPLHSPLKSLIYLVLSHFHLFCLSLSH